MGRAGKRGKYLCAAPMIEAATCTEGASIPMEKPLHRPAVTKPILLAATRSDTSAEGVPHSAATRAATMTCGTPLPWVPGNQRFASPTIAMPATGVKTNGSRALLDPS